MKYLMPDGRTVDRDSQEAVALRLTELERRVHGLLWFMVHEKRVTEEEMERIYNEPEMYDPSNPNSVWQKGDG